MKLYQGETGKTYLVNRVLADEKVTRRLEALGVNEDTPVTILNKKGTVRPDYQGSGNQTGTWKKDCRGY